MPQLPADESLSSLALVGLVCVPLFPLLLFSFGARPPDTANLPVSSDQLWATGGIVAATSVVVLGCFLVPGGLPGVGRWIAGEEDVAQAQVRPRSDRFPYSQARYAQRHPSSGKQPRRSGYGASRPQQPWQTRGQYVGRDPRSPAPLPALSYTEHKQAYHLAHLRATPLIVPYSEHGKMSIMTFSISSLAALLFLVIIFGQLVKPGYAADTAAPTRESSTKSASADGKKPSVEEEYEKREKRKTAEETAEETKKRRAKEKQMWDKRRKEEAAAKPKTTKLTVQQMYDAAEKKKAVGETEAQTEARRAKEKPKWDERFAKEREQAKADSEEKGKNEAKVERAETGETPATKLTVAKAKLSNVGQSLKRAFLGRRLTAAIEADATSGPGWKATPDHVAREIAATHSANAEAAAASAMASKKQSAE